MGLFAGCVLRLRWTGLAFLAMAAGDLRACFVCHPRRPALQQRRIVRTIGYPRLHSMLALSLLLEAKSPTSRKEHEQWGTQAVSHRKIWRHPERRRFQPERRSPCSTALCVVRSLRPLKNAGVRDDAVYECGKIRLNHSRN
jgi:hypothetical protein